MMSEGVDSEFHKILVVGLGVSGQSVCELLLKQGRQVIGTDLKKREQFGTDLDLLEQKGCFLRLGEHRSEDYLTADQIIVSPGVPLNTEVFDRAKAAGIEIIGELEWAWRQVVASGNAPPVIAVTGTNGKTTTTSLIGELLRASGKQVFVGGNIGTPLSRWILNEENAEVLVLEVSSFQLDTASRFFPQVGILLNITEDHLDRYEDFTAYTDSKFSLFARQSSAHVAIVNGDDPLCRTRIGEIRGRTMIFSRKDRDVHATIQNRQLEVHLSENRSFSLNLERCPLQGGHNEENILAAVLAVTTLGVSPSTIQEVLDRYHGLPHRVEWVRKWHGIDFYDDSKATNVGAVVKAVESFDRPILLLLGGRDKLGSYEPLLNSLNGKGKGVFVFGEAAPRLYQAFKKEIQHTRSFPDLEAAFQEAVRRGEPGDVVLLSPACSSFDQYTSYAQRGDHFKRLVNRLE